MTRTFRVVTAAVLLAALIPSPAQAGIDPSPFDVMIRNRSDLVAPDSPHYMQIMYAPKVYVEVQVVGAPLTEIVEIDPGLNGLAAGESVLLNIKLTQAGGSITGWGFTARMGIDPMPFHPVFAMEGATAEAPTVVPILPLSLVAGAKLYAFASPGTVVGEALLSSDLMSTDGTTTFCPPAETWKNHGQYVRCVTFRATDLTALGVITEDQADEIVGAAARSSVGK